MARRDHAGVAPARLGRHHAVALEDDDLVAVFLELIGGRHADHAAAENDYSHDVTPCKGVAKIRAVPPPSTKIGTLHPLVIEQILARAGKDDAAAFHDIGVVGDVERHHGVLLDE